MHIAVKAPYLTFVRTGAEGPLRIAKEPYKSVQKQAALPEGMATYDQLLCRYQRFVDAAIEDYRNLYSHYTENGGTASFYDRCWTLLLKDATEEAAGLLNHPAMNFKDRESLWRDMKRIAEGCLLVLDKALV